MDSRPNSAFGGLSEGFDGRLDPLSLWRVATWEYDVATDFVYWFDAPTDVLALPPETGELLLEPILTSLRHGAPWDHYDLERRVADRDGTPVDLRLQARCVYGADGKVSGCVGAVTDISEQRRAERVLRSIIERYRRLVELSPDPLVVHQDGIIRYVSPAGLRMAGVTDPSELLGHSVLDFVHPDSLEDTIERMARLTEPGMASDPAEATLLRADGSRVAVESISVRIEWEGEPAYQVILRDITERKRAEAALRYEASLIAHVSDAVVATDLEGKIRSWNRSAEKLYGRRADEVLGRSVAEVLGPSAVNADGSPRAGEISHESAAGTREMHVSVAPLRDELGDATGTVAVCTDLTERLGRLAAEARYRAAVAALDEGVVVVDGDGIVVSANASARAMLGDWLVEGVHSDELSNRGSLFDEERRALTPEDHPLARGLRTGEPSSAVVIGRRSDDDASERWFSISVRPLRSGPADSGGLVCSFSEITERKRIKDELAFQATHDSLTRLPNRDLTIDALTRALAKAEQNETLTALLLLDLDRFKAVNDTFGHVVGDEVLQLIAERIRRAARDIDYLGRLAGDEFMVVCPAVTSVSEAQGVAEAIAAAIGEPVRLPSGQSIVVTASIGIACTGRQVPTPQLVLTHADLAMYRAKQLGRARIEVFDDTLHMAVARQLHVHERLRTAMESEEITVHYQPVVDAETGAVVGAEVLARWDDPRLGSIAPTEFIPVAEDNGLMVRLGTQILLAATAEASRWRAQGRCDPDFMLSVNLSPRQLDAPEFVGTVAAILDETGFDPHQLWFEITESVLIEEAGRVSNTLSELQALGVHFAIDDFGTGYSSLALLKRLPVDAVKIDRSFVAGLTADPESDAIVAAIMSLARSLRLRTVAEGVENPAQLARLRELGCELVQGYLFGVPAPPDQLEGLRR